MDQAQDLMPPNDSSPTTSSGNAVKIAIFYSPQKNEATVAAGHEERALFIF